MVRVSTSNRFLGVLLTGLDLHHTSSGAKNWKQASRHGLLVASSRTAVRSGGTMDLPCQSFAFPS